MRNVCKNLSEKLKGKYNLGDLGVMGEYYENDAIEIGCDGVDRIHLAHV
jgi:hypothetical protein